MGHGTQLGSRNASSRFEEPALAEKVVTLCYLIGLTDDYRVLVSHNKVPAELRSLFSSQMNRIQLPVDKRLWPHAAYLGRHRERFVTG
jgi:hypothetical protein